MRYDQKLPCTMSIEFPTYEDMDEDYKHLIDELQKSYISLSLVVAEESDKLDYTFQSDEVEYTKVIDESSNHIKLYRTQLFLSTMEMTQEQYDAIVQQMGEEFANKWATVFGNKLTTIQTYVIVEYGEMQGKTIIDHGYELIPVIFKFKVNGVVNTDETIVPVLPINDKGGIFEKKYIDIMSSKDKSALPDKCHIETFRDLSKHHVIAVYNPQLISYLRSIDPTAIEDIYIFNYFYGNDEMQFYYVKLPKELYSIDNTGMIRDSSDPTSDFDFDKLKSEYNITIHDGCFNNSGDYMGEVYAVLDPQKLGIETATGEMIIKMSGGKGKTTKEGDNNDDKGSGTKAKYFNRLFICPMYYNEDKDISDKTAASVFVDYYETIPYFMKGNNGFTSIDENTMTGFEAVINGVTYGDSSLSDKIIIGFKDDGFPNSQYCLDDSNLNLICGYVSNPYSEEREFIPTPQVVTAYILTLPNEESSQPKK